MEPFTRLAKRVGMDDQLPAVARLVFAALDSALDKQTGHCAPTLAGLAAWVGRGPRAVQRAIGRLEAAGYIAVARSSGRRNAYRLLPTPDNFDPGTPVKNDTGTPVKNDTGTPVKNDTGSAAPFRMSELRTRGKEQATPPRPVDLFTGHYREWFTAAVRYHLGDRPDLVDQVEWFPQLAADFFLARSWHRTSDPETAVGWARRLAAIGTTEAEARDAFGWALGSPGTDAAGRKVFSRPDHLARIVARVQSQRRRHGGRTAEGPITAPPAEPPAVPAEVLAAVRRRFPDLVPDGLHFRREVLAELARAGANP